MRCIGPAIVSGVLALAGCAPSVYHCQDDGQCESGDRSGLCVDGHCAFESQQCPSGWAYAELAPPELANTCVPETATTQDEDLTSGDDSDADAIADTSSGSVGASTSGEPTGGACDPSSPCTPDDPCAVAGHCDADGLCIVTQWVACDDPPGPCHIAPGTCTSSGACEYPLAQAGLDCDDGDPCTAGGTCDGAGQCSPGEACPTPNPCEVGVCTDAGCSFEPLPNGTSCGDAASKRCCEGNCVDISQDVAHCGGCNTACAPGLTCESVAATSTCDSSPAQTSGRCRCQFSNAQCPNGQICRTVTPFTDRCTPPDPSACDGSFVYLATCPNYCSY